MCTTEPISGQGFIPVGCVLGVSSVFFCVFPACYAHLHLAAGRVHTHRYAARSLVHCLLRLASCLCASASVPTPHHTRERSFFKEGRVANVHNEPRQQPFDVVLGILSLSFRARHEGHTVHVLDNTIRGCPHLLPCGALLSHGVRQVRSFQFQQRGPPVIITLFVRLATLQRGGCVVLGATSFQRRS